MGQRKNKSLIRALLFLISIVPVFQFSIIPLFRVAGGAAGGCTASAGGTGGAFKLSAAGKGKGGHHPMDFLAFALRTNNLFRGIEYQFFEFVLTLIAVVLINRHLTNSFSIHRNLFLFDQQGTLLF
jgi:hypothetical protein